MPNNFWSLLWDPLLTMQAHLAKAFLGKTKANRTFSCALDPANEIVFIYTSKLSDIWHNYTRILYLDLLFVRVCLSSGSDECFSFFGEFWTQSKRERIWSAWVMTNRWDVSLISGLESFEHEHMCEDVSCSFQGFIHKKIRHLHRQSSSVWMMRLTFRLVTGLEVFIWTLI